jgi:hypothetical protein
VKKPAEKSVPAPSIERSFLVELVNAAGTLHASVDKTVYIRPKNGAVENNESDRT